MSSDQDLNSDKLSSLMVMSMVMVTKTFFYVYFSFSLVVSGIVQGGPMFDENLIKCQMLGR